MDIQLTRAVKISGYGLVSAGDVPARDVRKWDVTFDVPADAQAFVKSQVNAN